MLKSGVPPAAVQHKMSLEGVPQGQQEVVLRMDTTPCNDIIQPATEEPPVEESHAPVTADHLNKYKVVTQSVRLYGGKQGANRTCSAGDA